MAKIVTTAALLVLLFSSSCGDDEGQRLFEIQYPVIEFFIPAGQTRVRTFVIPQASLRTRFMEEMSAAGVTADQVDLVGGLRARVTSLTGDDFGEFERVELRVCPVGQEFGCNSFDLMFSVNDLFRRRQLSVNLNPGLRNFRELFLGDERVRVELIFTAGDISFTALEARLEWSIQAVGGLD